MNGVQIEYLLGLYFLIISLSFDGGRVGADAVRLIAGIVLLVAAILGFTPIG